MRNYNGFNNGRDTTEGIGARPKEILTLDLRANNSLAVVMPSLHDLNFKYLRKQKGLTLRKVEEITGISNAYLSQLETGKIKSPSYETVKTLCELYGSNEAQ